MVEEGEGRGRTAEGDGHADCAVADPMFEVADALD